MPTASLSSCVLTWPDLATVRSAVLESARNLSRDFPEVLAVGIFGSGARGSYGPGSDVDVVIVLKRSNAPAFKRSLRYASALDAVPVGVDLVVYTMREVEHGALSWLDVVDWVWPTR